MKRVRVLKELPFAKVGELIDLKEDGSIEHFISDNKCYHFSSIYVDMYASRGWLEWVEEEKSLEQKLSDCNYFVSKEAYNVFSKVAQYHYLEVFDKAIKDHDNKFPEQKDSQRKVVRKAIEEA